MPNRGQSGGRMRPLKTSPQRQPGMVLVSGRVISNRGRASKAANAGRMARPESGMTPRPRQRAGAGANTVSMISLALGLPWGLTPRP